MGTQINAAGVIEAPAPLLAGEPGPGVARPGGGSAARAHQARELRQAAPVGELNGDELGNTAPGRLGGVPGAGQAALASPGAAYVRGAESAAAAGYAPELGLGTLLAASGTSHGLASTSGLAAGGLSDKGAKSLARFAGVARLLGGAGMMSTDGLEFQARRAVGARLADSRDASMIGMIGNQGIPIEDLIFHFLAYMSQKYEDKLREKMEETALAEKMERRQEQRTNEARKAGSMISSGAGLVGTAFGPLGGIVGGLVGKLAGEGIESAAQKVNEIDSALNGGAKSSTLLASEIQVLMHKWKQLTELLSNVSRTLHEMAMTPIRNIRS